MRAIAALKQPAEGLAADADVVKTAAMLPAGAQWVGYVSPSGAVAFVKWIIDTMTPEGRLQAQHSRVPRVAADWHGREGVAR